MSKLKSSAAVWIECMESGQMTIRAVADAGSDAEAHAHAMVGAYSHLISGGRGASRAEATDGDEASAALVDFVLTPQEVSRGDS